MAELALIGRADELELARGLLRRAAEGTPGVLLVGGEAGVGPQPARRGDRRRGHGARVPCRDRDLRADGRRRPHLRGDRRGCCVASPARSTRARSRGTLGAYRHQVARLLPEITAAACPEPPSPPREDPMARPRLFEARHRVAQPARRARAAAARASRTSTGPTPRPSTSSGPLPSASPGGPCSSSRCGPTRRSPPAVQATVAELVRDGAERIELAPLRRDELAGSWPEARPAAPTPTTRSLTRCSSAAAATRSSPSSSSRRGCWIPGGDRHVVRGACATSWTPGSPRSTTASWTCCGRRPSSRGRSTTLCSRAVLGRPVREVGAGAP